ncbi:Hypothetical predicted protein [Pelobates cultripes]|uniref:Uncharacterized protein n=1 Tax=Pelobates cultripes TaxID=61616 RepID=A0AAD1TQI1_PELCU|nr:Hypothetical predicted protein [Pelobates cultripes]
MLLRTPCSSYAHRVFGFVQQGGVLPKDRLLALRVDGGCAPVAGQLRPPPPVLSPRLAADMFFAGQSPILLQCDCHISI